MAVRIQCCHAIDIGMAGTVQCSLGLFGGYPHAGTCNNCLSHNRVTGLGDVIAVIAKPIAKAIGMKRSCGGCQKRQKQLNQMIPFNQGEKP